MRKAAAPISSTSPTSAPLPGFSTQRSSARPNDAAPGVQDAREFTDDVRYLYAPVAAELPHRVANTLFPRCTGVGPQLPRGAGDHCEHARPLLLLQRLCERLHAQTIVRPGLTWLERSVATAQQQAQTVTWELIAPRLNAEDRSRLDRLLVVDEEIGLTPLTRFRTGATSHSAGAILKGLEKIAALQVTGLTGRELTALNPNRLKRLARIGAVVDMRRVVIYL
jgi:hypothetical protein